MSTRYSVGDTAVCGECRYPIVLVRVHAAEGELWIHTGSRLPFCYRDPQRTEMAWPESLVEDRPSPVLGFLVQCQICPQQALVATQPDGEWLCPRCAEVAEPAGTFRSVLVRTETQGTVHHFGPHDIVSQTTSEVECVVYCNCGQQFYGSLPGDAHRVHREHRAYQERGEVGAAPDYDDEYPLGKVRG